MRKFHRAAIACGVLAATGGCTDKVGKFDRTPRVVSTAETRARVDVPYAPTIVAADPEGGAITYELVAGPQGLTIDATTGAMSWTPTLAQQGQHAVHVRATDPEGLSGEQQYVVAVGLNAPPVVYGFPADRVCVGSTESTLFVADPDDDPVTITVANPPAGFAVDASTGAVTLTATAQMAGDYVLEVHAADPYGGETARDVAVRIDGFVGNPSVNTRIQADPERDAYDAQIAVAADGATWLTWYDQDANNSQDGKVWVSRLDPDGGCPSRPVEIGPGTPGYTAEEEPQLTPGPDGGMYVAYSEYYYGGGNEAAFARVQRYAADGRALWPQGGVRLTSDASYVEEYDVNAVSADASGVVVSFYEDNTGYNYFQKISPEGTRLWGSDGVLVGGGYYLDWRTTTGDGRGGAISVYDNYRTIYMQRFESEGGASVWPSQQYDYGRAVLQPNPNCGSFNYDPQVVRGPGGNYGDHSYYVIGIYYDGCAPTAERYKVVAQRVSQDGIPLWGLRGAVVWMGQYQPEPGYEGRNLAVNAAGDLFVTWRQSSPWYEPVVQRVSGEDGVPVWMDAVPMTNGASSGYYPTIVADGDEATVLYRSYGGSSDNIFAQRFDADGYPLWGYAGILVSSAPDEQDYPRAVIGPTGRIVATWEDYRYIDGNWTGTVHVQGIRPDGTLGE